MEWNRAILLIIYRIAFFSLNSGDDYLPSLSLPY